MKYLWVRTLHGQTDRSEKGRKRLTSPEEKNWIVLNVEPIARAFKANVLHPSKSLTMPID
ncbi:MULTISPECIES: hypothetical protein [Pseudomonas]|uniref:hypothetical protein n=2 Tax=Pseudomonas TaxID=286 RepID=UPI0013D4C1A9|nr:MULTISPECIES: hypothetical protein [Pseudomonas]UZE14015.1 hypothetical protein LOY68_10485 [Pseudomonas sp. B21-053]